ncbi:MAG: nitroreductase family protein [bacterium]|nr:nitroreductase family protein [bacterium]
MQKPAVTDYPIHPLLEQRWSPRAFADTPIPHDTLMSLFEAARWSASTFNEQPWRFIVATKDQPEAYEKIFKCLNEGNQRWAGNAPVLMLTLAVTTFAVDGSPIRTALYDVGLAVQNLIVQATSHELVVRQMAGILIDRIREVYALPEHVVPVTGLAVGYRGDPDILIERLRTRELEPRTRKPLADLLIGTEWGTVSPLVTPAKDT